MSFQHFSKAPEKNSKLMSTSEHELRYIKRCVFVTAVNRQEEAY